MESHPSVISCQGPRAHFVLFFGSIFPLVSFCYLLSPISEESRGCPVPEIRSVCGEQPPRPGPSPWVCPSWMPLPPATVPKHIRFLFCSLWITKMEKCRKKQKCAQTQAGERSTGNATN